MSQNLYEDAKERLPVQVLTLRTRHLEDDIGDWQYSRVGEIEASKAVKSDIGDWIVVRSQRILWPAVSRTRSAASSFSAGTST
jgi:hypothetical protein